VEFDQLIEEHARERVGQGIYGLVVDTVRAVAVGRGYPPSYSPTGRWDEDALTALAHDWLTRKLLGLGHLEHLLLSNETARGFRKGLELAFTDFLVGQKKRTQLDNLFRRARLILQSDVRFRQTSGGTSASANWALTEWQDSEPFGGSDGDLIAAGLEVGGVEQIRYRSDAQKLSPVLSDEHLAAFLEGLLRNVGAPISLERMMLTLQYRFDLQNDEEVSVDRPMSEDGGPSTTVGDMIRAPDSVEESVLLDVLVDEVLALMPTRQQWILVEYARPGATLTSVADRVGCSKSTVDNELRRALALIRRAVDSPDEAEAVYGRLLEDLEQ
jgi:hypothetical protein